MTSILLHRLSVCLALKTAFNCSVAACMYRIVLQHPFCFIAFCSVAVHLYCVVLQHPFSCPAGLCFAPAYVQVHLALAEQVLQTTRGGNNNVHTCTTQAATSTQR